MDGKIVLNKGASLYGVGEVFIDELARALRGLGREVVVLRVGTAGYAARLAELLDGGCDFAAAFGADGLAYQGPDPYRARGVPLVGMLLDHPAHHWEAFQYDHVIWTCADRDHAAFVERAFGGRRHLPYLPPAGSAPPDAPARQGPPRLVFSGTYLDPDEVMAGWHRRYEPDIAELLGVMAAHAVTHPEKSITTALEEVFAANDFPKGEETLRRSLPSAYLEVDRVVRNHRRLECLRRLDEAGVAVELFGHGWEGVGFKHHRARGPVEYRRAVVAGLRAGIVLNLAPHRRGGPHDRMLSAMLGGAVVVSDHSPFVEWEFEPDMELLTFRWEELDALPTKLAVLLEEPERMAAMARLGRERAAAEHTWTARARRLIEIVAEARETLRLTG